MDKFSKLFEYIINNEEQKAADIFHEIVIERSRSIYEGIMDDDENVEELTVDPSDDLLSDITADEEGITADEEGITEEGDEIPGDDELAVGGEEEEEFGEPDELGGEEELGAETSEDDLEDRVANLEDDLDDLLQQFEELMASEEGEEELGGEEEFGGEEELGGEEEFGGEEEEAEPEFEEGLGESVSLTKITKGLSNSTEESSVNKKSVNNDNSGKSGMASKPVKTDTSEETGRPAPSSKDMGGTTKAELKAAPAKPKMKGEESGINKKSITS